MKIHFIHEATKPLESAFAQTMMQKLGQHGLGEATRIVTIGGDGLLARTLQIAGATPVIGVAAPGTGSYGFWTSRGIENADDLVEILSTAPSYPVKPLQADITFADGSSTTRYGYNDITIQKVHQTLTPEQQDEFGRAPIDVSVQSMLVNLRVDFQNASLGPYRLMASGVILATPLGSTAVNRNYGGPSIDIRDHGIVMTQMGAGGTDRRFTPIVNDDSRVFHFEIKSPAKRPVMVTFDSFGVVGNGNDSPIREVRVASAPHRTANLVLNDDPGLRAYSALLP